MAAQPTQPETSSLAILWRLAGFIRPHRRRLAGVIALVLGMTAAFTLTPLAFGWGVDALRAVAAADDSAAQDVWRQRVIPAALVFLGVILGGALLTFIRGVASAHWRQLVLTDIRCRLYDVVQRLPFEYHDRTPTGELISRSTRDVRLLAVFIGGAMFGILELLLYGLGLIIVLALVNWRLGALVIGPLVVAAAMFKAFAGRLRLLWRESSDKYALATTVLQENIAGVRVVRAFGREQAEVRKFDARTNDFLDQMTSNLRYWSGRMPFAGLVAGICWPAVLGVGGYLVASETITLGALMAALSYAAMLSQRIASVGDILNQCQTAAAGAERIFGILDEPRPIANPRRPRPLPRDLGRIEFRAVSFEYEPGTPVLRDISLCVEPGEMVAVVGRTGSGKSTLAGLIPRFHDATEGAVVLNGADVRDLDLRALRRSIGLIFQDTLLFSTTVADNIAYGRPGVDFERIRQAARDAQAEDFILHLPDGYQTVIGERGVGLSGGQRQRIAIARAFITDPRILIMDDATASVDAHTERRIHLALQAVARGRTTLVIAHRLATVRRADRIVVLDDGRITDTGAHEQLMARCEVYHDLFRTQMTGDPPS